MPGALYNADNVVVGNAIMYLTPWVPPPGSPQALVADTALLFDDTAWLAATPAWAKAGATHEGFKVNVDTSTNTISIEEQSTPVDETVEGKAISVEAALAEDTLATIKLAWGGGLITTTARTAGTVPGSNKMGLTDTSQKWTVALEMRNSFGLARRIYIPKMSLVGSGDTEFRRAADKRVYPVRLNSLCAPSAIQIVEITAAA